MTFDNSISYRLVVRFRTQKQLDAWLAYFMQKAGVIHVEKRVRRDVDPQEKGDI